MSPEEAVEVALGDSGLDLMADPADIIAALRAVRYVVVELPDPDSDEEVFVCSSATGRPIVNGIPGSIGAAYYSVAEARSLGSALLAAAEVAEAS